MSDSVRNYLDILLATSATGDSPLGGHLACIHTVIDCATGDSEGNVAFAAAVYRHPTAVRTLLAAVPTLSPNSTESERLHAYRFVCGLSFIAGSELLLERLVCSDELMRTLSACCEQCRTPPLEFDLFNAYVEGLLSFVGTILLACKARIRSRVVDTGVLRSAIGLYASELREHKRRGISGCTHIIHDGSSKPTISHLFTGFISTLCVFCVSLSAIINQRCALTANNTVARWAVWQNR